MEIKDLEHALGYFRKHRDQASQELRKTAEPYILHSEKNLEFVQNAGILAATLLALTKYDRDAMEHLERNGFRIHYDVIYRNSQWQATSISRQSSKDKISATSDEFEHVVRVLEAYSQILPYEQKLAEYKKIKALEEALTISRG